MIKTSFLYKLIQSRPTLKKVLESIGWSFLDNLFRKVIGFFIGAWVARYLGPSQFGLWNYALALTSLFGVLASLGAGSIAVRELVRSPEKRDELIGTTFVLYLLGSLISFSLILIYSLYIAKVDSFVFILILINSVSFFFYPFAAVSVYYHAQLLLKYTIWAYNIAFIIVVIIKILLIWHEASLTYFVITGPAEAILGICLLTWFYVRNVGSLRSWRFSYTLAKALIRSGFPLALSSVALMIYARIDQVMIREMLGDLSLGLYSVAVKISEVWYFVPGAIASAAFPAVLRSKELGEEVYLARLSKYFALMAWIGLSVGFFFALSGSYIVNLLFGSRYEGSVGALRVLVWSGIGVCLRAAGDSWFISEGLERSILCREILGAGLNVLLNLLWIPAYGINGAALATLVSYSFVGILYDYLDKKTRKLFFMKLRAFPYGVHLLREYGMKLLRGGGENGLDL